MRSFRFLLSRRWALFAVAVALAAYAAWLLGQWQFSRLEERQARNAVVRANEDRPAVPVSQVLSPGGTVGQDQEWRLVTATGRYAVEDTVIVRYRTRGGAMGVDVVVPLVPAAGPALIVDRGWLPAGGDPPDPGDVPGPPAGPVQVTGWVRADATGSSTTVTDRSARAVSSEAIGEAVGREVYGGFVELRSEDPPPATPLEPVQLPELDNGPHFFYGLQWWFFGLLAVGGFLYLLYDEWRGGSGGRRLGGNRRPAGQSARSMPPSTGSIAPETNEAAGDSRKVAARPNSSGSP